MEAILITGLIMWVFFIQGLTDKNRAGMAKSAPPAHERQAKAEAIIVMAPTGDSHVR